ncbi:penicillin-binding protein 2 [Effusibacillus lacus]|uniref:Penicillin-binding protein n=1 Tax=Effusibacillus lacus TaxID=1348429 RepID=A0A292YKE4_9BACL|nr:penicillin-binding protein 2 [Effusibacillus lacus]TCS71796.1 peptidoglycan glycosyltransferase [Effusibacillus lacus]GAX89636.1 penicillin-binding protein [Effusibacillus lacus]
MEIREEEKKPEFKRIQILFLIFFVGLAALLLRLSHIQLKNSERYQQMAEANRYAQRVLPAPRGQFKDREGNVLVTNKPSFTIQYTNPFALDEEEEADRQIRALADRLIALLEDPEDKSKPSKEKLIELMKGEDGLPRSAPRKVKVNATVKQVAKVKEHLHELPGITVIPEAIREYPLQTFASHIFGYLNGIPPEKWPEYAAKGYQISDRIGFAGLERQYESELRGKDGTASVAVDKNGDPVDRDPDAYYVEKKPVPGNDLILTINSELQKATEEALAQRVAELRKIPGNRVEHAAAVAMEPNTGEILALASYPFYDPNIWTDGLSYEEEASFRPAEMNRVIQAPYAPGSTVKMLTTMIGLKEGIVKPDEQIYSSGHIYIGSYRANDWKIGGHGPVNGKQAIAESVNTYNYRIGMGLAKYDMLFNSIGLKEWKEKYEKPAFEKFKQYQREFGLGVPTGIDLPFEAEGRYNFDENAITNLPFLAIGQNSNFTPLQLAQYVSAIANGGKRMKPYLVKEIVGPDGKLVKRTEPEVLNTVSFGPDLLQYVREGMWMVTHDPKGTAYYPFANKDYRVAGKTGTAETGTTDNYWFVGFAPYEKPEIVVAVVVPDGKKNALSSDMAGPIAEKMLDTYFRRTSASAGQ